jgi:RimJ/RimL family protein N-acetyltransferase
MNDVGNPASFSRVCHLRDGSEVLMRAARPDDLDKVVDAFHALEPESIYTRFHGPKRELSAGDISRFRSIDFVHAIMLVLTRQVDGKELIIGGVSCFFGPTPEGAEMAEISFTVEEDYQGQGLAGQLLQVVVDMARRRGTVRLEAEVLGENTAMLKVFERSGLPLHKTRQGGEVHVEMALQPASA